MTAERYQRVVVDPHNTSVLCLACGRWVKLLDAVVDRLGEPFKAYYHAACVPQEAK